MYKKYESAFYYKNPEIQLIVNLQRVRDELDALLQLEACDRCMGLRCACLDRAATHATHGAYASHATHGADVPRKIPEGNTKKDVKDKENAWKDVKEALKDVKEKDVKDKESWKDKKEYTWNDVRDKCWNLKEVNATAATAPAATAVKEAKWSFKVSQLNVEEDIWRRSRPRPLEEKYLSSERAEEFFQSLRKRSVKC